MMLAKQIIIIYRRLCWKSKVNRHIVNIHIPIYFYDLQSACVVENFQYNFDVKSSGKCFGCPKTPNIPRYISRLFSKLFSRITGGPVESILIVSTIKIY